jgi:hypothetical protein
MVEISERIRTELGVGTDSPDNADEKMTEADEQPITLDD